jgi:SRSO17 transposase
VACGNNRLAETCRIFEVDPAAPVTLELIVSRVITAGVRFGCVLADAGYGLSAPFRQGLTARGLVWAVGFPGRQKVYPAEV